MKSCQVHGDLSKAALFPQTLPPKTMTPTESMIPPTNPPNIDGTGSGSSSSTAVTSSGTVNVLGFTTTSYSMIVAIAVLCTFVV